MMTDEIDERYAELVLQRPVYRFLQRFFLSEAKTQDLIIISPFMTTLEGTRYTLSSLRDKIERERIPTYVITRKPEDKAKIAKGLKEATALEEEAHQLEDELLFGVKAS